jgi:hypothetical protein
MPSPKAPSPTHRVDGGRAQRDVGFGGPDNPIDSKRSARRQYLARHLHACGPRPLFEALLAIEGGQTLDRVLEDFARLRPEIYAAIGADVLPIDEVAVIDGGRR